MNRGDERKVVKGIKKRRSDLFLLSFVAGTLQKCPIKFQLDLPYKKQLQFSVPLVFIKQFEQNLKSKGTSTFFLDSMGCMFKAKINSFDSRTGTLWTSYPRDIAFQERRQKDRFILHRDMTFLYNMDEGGVVNKKVYDISEGGFSLAFSQMERFRVEEGELLRNVFFQYGASVQYIDVKVLRILKPTPFELESMPYVNRVSFTFVNMDEDQKLFVESIIGAETSLQKRKTS